MYNGDVLFLLPNILEIEQLQAIELSLSEEPTKAKEFLITLLLNRGHCTVSL
jgi:hypothetical protein